jgi:hypothetical protein
LARLFRIESRRDRQNQNPDRSSSQRHAAEISIAVSENATGKLSFLLRAVAAALCRRVSAGSAKD